MHVTSVTLLSRKTRPEGRICALLGLNGDRGEHVQILCEVRTDILRSHRAENAALAEDALRQLRRMPEYRLAEVSVAKFAMPQPPQRRALHLAG